MKKIRRKLRSTLGRDELLEEIRNMDHSRLTSVKEYPTYIDHQNLTKDVQGNILQSLKTIRSRESSESSTAHIDSEPESKSDPDLVYGFVEEFSHRFPITPSLSKERNPTFIPASRPKSLKQTHPIPPSRTSIPPRLRELKFPSPPLPQNLHPVVPPAIRKYSADRQGVIQKVSDISMTNSTFQADIIKAPHVKVETFVCCSIHIGETECDCKKSLKKKSKMQNLVKIVRGTSFVLGTYILYHLHDIFDSD